MNPQQTAPSLPSLALPTPPAQPAPMQPVGPASTQPGAQSNQSVQVDQPNQPTQSGQSAQATPQTIEIPGGGGLTQLIPISTQDVHNLLISAQKFPSAFGTGSPITSSTSSNVQSTPNVSAPADRQAIQNQITQAATQMFGADQVEPLLNIVKHESNFNPNAQNPHSTAYGIFQFLDSTWKGVGASKTSDPNAQIQAGLNYIKQRYGTPQAAWAFHQSHGWY